MDQLDRDVSNRVKAAIEDAGISVRELATKTGIPRVTLGRRIEFAGDFTVRELERVADALRVPTSSLVPDRTYAS